MLQTNEIERNKKLKKRRRKKLHTALRFHILSGSFVLFMFISALRD